MRQPRQIRGSEIDEAARKLGVEQLQVYGGPGYRDPETGKVSWLIIEEVKRVRRRKHHRARTIVFHVDDQSKAPDYEATIWSSGSGKKKVVKGLPAIAPILLCSLSSSEPVELDLANVQKGLLKTGMSAANPNNVAGWARATRQPSPQRSRGPVSGARGPDS